jgi:small-conductance mechanosensitive channel
MAVVVVAGGAHAAEAPSAMPQMGGWFEHGLAKLEAEAMSDLAAAPDVWSAIVREWRSLASDGTALGTLIGLVWVALATAAALFCETGAKRFLSRRPLRRLAAGGDDPTLSGLLALIVCDVVGVAAFVAVFTAARRNFLPLVGVSDVLAMLSANVLVRWRILSLIIGAIIRPDHAIARLIDIPDDEARRLQRFLSAAVLAVVALIAFGRYGLMDEDSGAPHVFGLLIAVLVCGLYVLIAFRSRAATEALIRGRRTDGVVAALRNALAGAWIAVALTLIAGLLLVFIAGLSLGLLSYYHATAATLGVLFLLIVLDRFIERTWNDTAPIVRGTPDGIARLHAQVRHRLVRAVMLAGAVLALAWVWTGTIHMSDSLSDATMRSVAAAVVTLFVAYVLWQLVRLAIDRHLHTTSGPPLPGADADDDTGTPASRLETILPLLRAAFGIAIAVLTALIVLSRLGVDTAPLIAGAGVFGLALSFGSQSLVRDIISGLFYMWDDAFRVGEYIDTGRLKGTVEALGVRSVKVRHQNGPLHTIPYGQLGAVTNLSRDFATIKFNMRFDPRTDVEFVRKTTKQIGLAMQEDHPELAAEIMQPLKLQGVAEIVDNAIVLRFKFTARPIKPSWVQREYLKRMYRVFAEKGITFATGAVFIQTMAPIEAPPAAPSPAPAPEGPTPLATAAAAALGVAAGMEVAQLAEPAGGAAIAAK